MPMPADTNASRTASRVLGILALLALSWSAYEGCALRDLSEPLRTQAAPRGMISLQLAPTTAEANAILLDWSCDANPRDPCPGRVAGQALARDTRFILAYLSAWVLVALWAGTATRTPRWVTALFIGALVAGGVLDLAENWLHALALGMGDALPFARIAPLIPGLVERVTVDDTLHHHAFTLARLAAMSKFVLLLLGIAGSVAVAGGGLRLIFVRRQLKRETVKAGLESVVSELEPTITTFADLRRARDRWHFQGHPAPDTGPSQVRAARSRGRTVRGVSRRGRHRARALGRRHPVRDLQPRPAPGLHRLQPAAAVRLRLDGVGRRLRRVVLVGVAGAVRSAKPRDGRLGRRALPDGSATPRSRAPAVASRPTRSVTCGSSVASSPRAGASSRWRPGRPSSRCWPDSSRRCSSACR